MKRYLWTAAMAAALAAPLGAQITTVTNTPPTDGVTPLGKDSDFGTIPTAIVQTFMLPGGTNYLQAFSFFITGSGFGGGTDLQLRASVYTFDTDHLVGPALFFSALFNGTNDVLNFHEISFSSAPLNILLTPGVTYALMLSSVEEYASTPDHSTITAGATSSDNYADGALLVTTNTDVPSLSTPGAFFDAGIADAAFTAQFSPNVLPEPSSLVLLATGLVSVAGVVKRRRKATA